ncbi:Aste57867_15336 [Aphanomyces stellatus]|uniref:Aste57867_15336 protein n=1 Tax=Aphanomyces stellatus TaxID=120398 RepID=A0A485L3H3_9STRA|nr:hypothetical protein As57867_015280 [Aphanomyces stellatus]VFT92144.1 Aste57867_15336 [Aphanomyces stellatus]
MWTRWTYTFVMQFVQALVDGVVGFVMNYNGNITLSFAVPGDLLRVAALEQNRVWQVWLRVDAIVERDKTVDALPEALNMRYPPVPTRRPYGGDSSRMRKLQVSRLGCFIEFLLEKHNYSET